VHRSDPAGAWLLDRELAELVFDRLAATKVEKTRAGGKTINVVRLKITEWGGGRSRDDPTPLRRAIFISEAAPRCAQVCLSLWFLSRRLNRRLMNCKKCALDTVPFLSVSI
jgi:hypothetical protein